MRETRKHVGFTLVELITAMAVFSLLLIMIMSVVNSVTDVHATARAKADTFQQARSAFETIKRRLSQTTLQTYWDYQYTNNDPAKAPERFVRQSDLHFVCGSANELLSNAGIYGSTATHAVFFQVPSGFVDNEELRGLEALLSVVGFFIEFSDGEEYSPDFTDPDARPIRPRLIEAVQSAEANETYLSTGDENHDFRWIQNLALGGSDAGTSDKHVLATNVLALVLRPKLAEFELQGAATVIAPDFAYDSRAWENEDTEQSRLSRNQLPPVVEVILVAIDEVSASRLEASGQSLEPEALGLTGLFQSADDDRLEEDLRALEERLIGLKANYRIFRDNVILTNSRWSPFF